MSRVTPIHDPEATADVSAQWTPAVPTDSAPDQHPQETSGSPAGPQDDVTESLHEADGGDAATTSAPDRTAGETMEGQAAVTF